MLGTRGRRAVGFLGFARCYAGVCQLAYFLVCLLSSYRSHKVQNRGGSVAEMGDFVRVMGCQAAPSALSQLVGWNLTRSNRGEKVWQCGQLIRNEQFGVRSFSKWMKQQPDHEVGGVGFAHYSHLLDVFASKSSNNCGWLLCFTFVGFGVWTETYEWPEPKINREREIYLIERFALGIIWLERKQFALFCLLVMFDS